MFIARERYLEIAIRLILAKTRARTGKALMLLNEERHRINAISKVYLMYSA